LAPVGTEEHFVQEPVQPARALSVKDEMTCAKSGSAWSLKELELFNIQVENQNFVEFFGVHTVPKLNVPDGILNTYSSDAADAVNDKATANFLTYMEDAMFGAFESDVDNFALRLFSLMGYERMGDCLLKFNVDLSFKMCHSKCKAQTGICVMDRRHILLVVQEDKQACKNLEEELPVGQLVAETIAAFHNNNVHRRVMGKKPLADNLMLGIIMRGTIPYFHKIIITQNLVDCVEKGEHPAEPTKIYQHVPAFRDGLERGMRQSTSRP
jgi:hypothetical protein